MGTPRLVHRRLPRQEGTCSTGPVGRYVASVYALDRSRVSALSASMVTPTTGPHRDFHDDLWMPGDGSVHRAQL